MGSLTENIFISYRRNDTSAHAGRLYDRLSARFGDRRVFMDVDDIKPGQDFVQVLGETLDSCTVLIVLIGSAWNSGNNGGRLDDPDDFVRHEILKAIQKDILIVPVLVKEADMPATEDLPDAISAFVHRQAFQIRDDRFHQDVDQLIKSLESALHNGSGRRNTFLFSLAVCAVIILLAGLFLSGPMQRLFISEVELRSVGTTLSVGQVKTLLIEHDLFATNLNPAGQGLGANYERQLLKGEVLILDSSTGLMWHEGSASHQYTFHETESFISKLNANQHAGFNDWRVPTLEEAMSIVQPKAVDNWHLHPVFGKPAAPFIWTSDRASADRGWIVYYIDGDCGQESLDFNAYVRAVR